MASCRDHDEMTPFLAENVDEEKAIGASPPVDEEDSERRQDEHDLTGNSYIRSVVTVGILFSINLLNYMDRFTVAGVLPDLKSAFNIEDSESGLVQTVFICSYMVLAPVFGYLGDRWNRKYILCAGISLWSIITLCSSFIPNQYFLLFLLMRGLVGVGEASYSTIAPTIIADLFVEDQRSNMLAIFHMAVPAGCGLGYIVGSKVTSAAGGDWHWAFRVTPGFGLLMVLLIVFFMKEPRRGAAERESQENLTSKSWALDMKALLKSASFMLPTFGYTAGKFASGALDLWASTYLKRARIVQYKTEPCQTAICNYDDSVIFGVITVITGILGVAAGVQISRRYKKINPFADPLVCGFGMLGSAPFLFLALVSAKYSLVSSYVFIFIGDTLLSMNAAIVDDILLSVVTPTRRSTAEALQIMVSHLIGDAGSPYVIGVLSDYIRRGNPESTLWMFLSLQYSLMVCTFVAVIGGAFFLLTAIVFEKDRQRKEKVPED
ncbi:protein spinster homolog 1-like [Rhinoderma darwinii]|uniref:protein spinster homolog 1-like n=1 Tax=Rhinoderma darwinii TaxID=43563 RepID=UPI003F66EDAF